MSSKRSFVTYTEIQKKGRVCNTTAGHYTNKTLEQTLVLYKQYLLTLKSLSNQHSPSSTFSVIARLERLFTLYVINNTLPEGKKKKREGPINKIKHILKTTPSLGREFIEYYREKAEAALQRTEGESSGREKEHLALAKESILSTAGFSEKKKEEIAREIDTHLDIPLVPHTHRGVDLLFRSAAEKNSFASGDFKRVIRERRKDTDFNSRLIKIMAVIDQFKDILDTKLFKRPLKRREALKFINQWTEIERTSSLFFTDNYIDNKEFVSLSSDIAMLWQALREGKNPAALQCLWSGDKFTEKELSSTSSNLPFSLLPPRETKLLFLPITYDISSQFLDHASTAGAGGMDKLKEMFKKIVTFK